MGDGEEGVAPSRRKRAMNFRDGSTLPTLKDWELSQAKTFTRWANSYLKAEGLPLIEDISMDFADGVRLIQLMEVLRGSSLGKYFKNPKIILHCIENLNLPLNEINTFLKAKGIRLFYSAENLMNREIKPILGLMWILISQFNLASVTEEGMAAKEALLLWCHKKVKGYGLQAKDFKEDWRDGKNLCAIIHFHRPELIPHMERILANSTSAYDNLSLALDVAENQLGIPRLLDPEDVLQFADEKSMVTMVSFFWKAFAAMATGETAARRVARIIDMEIAKEELLEQYKGMCLLLAEKIVQRTCAFKRRFTVGDLSLEELQAKNNDFLTYKKELKVQMADEKGRVEATLSSIQAKVRSTGRASYEPPRCFTTAFMNSLWADLLAEEQQYDAQLRVTMEDTVRLEKAQQLTNRVTQRYLQVASRLREAMQSRVEFYVTPVLYPNLVSAALSKASHMMERIRNYQQGEKVALLAERASAESILAGLQNTLRAEGFPPYLPPEGLAVVDLNALWSVLEEAESAYERQLVAHTIPELKRKNNVLVGFETKVAQPLLRVVEDVGVYLASAHQVDEHTNVHEASKTLVETELSLLEEQEDALSDHIASLQAQSAEVQREGLPQVEAKMEELWATMGETQKNLAARRTALERHLEQQRKMDMDRLQFAQEAEALNARIEETQRALQNPVAASTLEEATSLHEEVTAFREAFESDTASALQSLRGLAAATAAETTGNPYTRLCVDSVEAKLELTLSMFIERQDALVDAQRAQEDFNELRMEYVSRAAKFDEWTTEIWDRMQALAIPDDTTAAGLDRALALLRGLKPELEVGETKLLAAKAMDAALKESNIVLGSFTERTIFLLFRDFEEVSLEYTRLQKGLETELEMQRMVESSHARYTTKAHAHIAELEQQVERFSSVVFDAFALPDARQMEQHFQEYLNGAKVALLNERGAVDSVLNTLTTQLRVDWSEQARDPVEAALPAEVTRLWEALDAAEGRFQANLGMTLERLMQAAALRKGIQRTADAMEGSLGTLTGYLAQDGYLDMDVSANCVSAAADACRAHQEHVDVHRELLGKLSAFEAMVAEYRGNADEEEVNSIYYNLSEGVHAVEGLLLERERTLRENQAAAKQLDDIRLEFARVAHDFAFVLEEIKEELTQPVFCQSAAEVQWKQKALRDKEDELVQKKSVLSHLEALAIDGITDQQMNMAETISDESSTEGVMRTFRSSALTSHDKHGSNPYTHLTVDDITEMYRSVLELTVDRAAVLQVESEAQDLQSRLGEDFARQAAHFLDWCRGIKEQMTQGQYLEGAPEQQLQAVNLLGEEVQEIGTQLLKSVENAETVLDEAGVLNKPTSMSELNAEWELLHAMLSEKRSVLETTIAKLSAVGDVEADLMREYRDLFTRFDKRSKGKLQLHELKAVLTSLDTEVPEEKLCALGNEIGFQAFVNLMGELQRDVDTYDQIVESFGQLAGEGRSTVSLSELGVLSQERLTYLEAHMPKAKDGKGYDFRAYTAMVFSGEPALGRSGHDTETTQDEENERMQELLHATIAAAWEREQQEREAIVAKQQDQLNGRPASATSPLREGNDEVSKLLSPSSGQRSDKPAALGTPGKNFLSRAGRAEGQNSPLYPEANDGVMTVRIVEYGTNVGSPVEKQQIAGVGPGPDTREDDDAPPKSLWKEEARPIPKLEKVERVLTFEHDEVVGGTASASCRSATEEDNTGSDVGDRDRPASQTDVADMYWNPIQSSKLPSASMEELSSFFHSVPREELPPTEEPPPTRGIAPADEIPQTEPAVVDTRTPEPIPSQIRPQLQLDNLKAEADKLMRSRVEEEEERERQDELHRARKAGKKGWLVKRGGSRHSTAYNSEGSPMTSPMLKSLFSRRNWKRRLFVLDDVGYLYYYKDDNHIATATPAGKVDLTRASAVRKAEGPDTNVYYFLVNTSGGQEDNLLMGAETEATRAEWLQAIQMWIDHFRQPKTPPASPLPKSPKMRY